MIRKYMLILVFASLLYGCTRTLRTTVSLNKNLYLEYFIVNPFGVDEVFLTDSANFKVYIGKYDSDHERVRCEVKGDTIIVIKRKSGGSADGLVMDRAELSRDSLTKNKVHSMNPLFQFR